MTRDLQLPALPIREDDDAIARALERASIPTLMMSMVHLTGDTRLLRGAIRPRKAIMSEVQGGMPEQEKVAVRAQA
ncbi:MAG: 4-hydroxyacetophenone monooxygenase, partial [Proteobacteria bacterium]|nr:4-hydroxyacetophenone monooxygenase [Pseudomonadota bacterium]